MPRKRYLTLEESIQRLFEVDTDDDEQNNIDIVVPPETAEASDEEEGNDNILNHDNDDLPSDTAGSLICDAWNKSATVGNATRSFKLTGIFPFKNNALPDQLVFALADSEVRVPENTTQEEAKSSSEVLINTPQINLQPAEPGTSSVKPPSPTKHLHKISSIARHSKVTAKHRIKKTEVLLTSIENRNGLKQI
ncbi:hypothetical protein AVEN_147605-1 [Araneus ventricosus]|uniref:Uncharacterized protein n=1 Tax=Araneus ventricosus TaxID=182803 RepID=A0A4Y2H2Z8_ARAVE|nr:hypothetical protein AVEN_147605-1 [Araneus ventricosus]